jgi:hypothetical protein
MLICFANYVGNLLYDHLKKVHYTFIVVVEVLYTNGFINRLFTLTEFFDE